jgi:hypothetical protein
MARSVSDSSGASQQGTSRRSGRSVLCLLFQAKDRSAGIGRSASPLLESAPASAKSQRRFNVVSYYLHVTVALDGNMLRDRRVALVHAAEPDWVSCSYHYPKRLWSGPSQLAHLLTY